MSSDTLKCLKCNTECSKMDHFYICPNCMQDHATDEQMELVKRLHRTYSGDMRAVLVAVQHLVDADKERLRILLDNQDRHRQSLKLVNLLYKPEREFLTNKWKKL